MSLQTREFVIRQDSLPLKIMIMDQQRVTSLLRRLQARFPSYRWSVSERFPLNGSD